MFTGGCRVVNGSGDDGGVGVRGGGVGSWSVVMAATTTIITTTFPADQYTSSDLSISLKKTCVLLTIFFVRKLVLLERIVRDYPLEAAGG